MTGWLATFGLLGFMVAVAAGAFVLAWIQLRSFDRALAAGDFGGLQRIVGRDVRSDERLRPNREAQALRRRLEVRDLPALELIAFGDLALSSDHPFAVTCFEVAYGLLSERRRTERRRDRRVQAWRALRRHFGGES